MTKQHDSTQVSATRRRAWSMRTVAAATLALVAGLPNLAVAGAHPPYSTLECETIIIDVALVPGGAADQSVMGDLCRRSDVVVDGVQVLVHGATYDRHYWDSDFTRSYVSRTTQHGWATFAYDRLGNGESTKPAGLLLSVDTQAYVNSQVIHHLQSGAVGDVFDAVVQVGHSFGSLISSIAAATYHDVDAVVLTGFAHQVTEQANSGTQASVYPAVYDGKFAGVLNDDPQNPTYFTTTPGAREALFYAGRYDAAQVVQDEIDKGLMAVGLLADIPRHLSPETLAIDVPVMLIMGDQDFMYCGELIDCNDIETWAAVEANYFTTPPHLAIVNRTGHSLALHDTAGQTAGRINGWLDEQF